MRHVHHGQKAAAEVVLPGMLREEEGIMTCRHCGHRGNVHWDYQLEGFYCWDRVECWSRWDQQHLEAE